MALNQNARRVIRITPTVTGVQYANNDILFDTTEVPLAVGKKGECSKLVSAMIVSKSNSLFDLELFFCQVNQSVGTVNAARNVSDADWATAKVLGRLTLDSSADNYNYGNGRVHNFDRQSETYETTDQWKSRFPVLLQAAAGSTSVFTFAFVTGTDVTPELSVGDIELVLGVEY
jgi:hypothetical protein|tara:strand:- start:788 stop:1309 length:522 start_codon:yes stop_codon:yes gene_type:complete